ncbi:hypothetical protein QMN21_24185 [Serratia sp. Se-PFBMAAmG]|nr:hypothetical protein [Serratia sp. Se-PFBMAAmG]
MNKPFALLVICLTLAGCSTMNRAFQVLKDPTLPVGGPSNDISRVALSLYAAEAPVAAEPEQAGPEAPAQQLHQNYPGSTDDDKARAPADLASYAAGQSEPPPASDQVPQRQGPSSIAFKILQLDRQCLTRQRSSLKS